MSAPVNGSLQEAEDINNIEDLTSQTIDDLSANSSIEGEYNAYTLIQTVHDISKQYNGSSYRSFYVSTTGRVSLFFNTGGYLDFNGLVVMVKGNNVLIFDETVYDLFLYLQGNNLIGNLSVGNKYQVMSHNDGTPFIYKSGITKLELSGVETSGRVFVAISPNGKYVAVCTVVDGELRLQLYEGS